MGELEELTYNTELMSLYCHKLLYPIHEQIIVQQETHVAHYEDFWIFFFWHRSLLLNILPQKVQLPPKGNLSPKFSKTSMVCLTF